jgi:hypothetical protein
LSHYIVALVTEGEKMCCTGQLRHFRRARFSGRLRLAAFWAKGKTETSCNPPKVARFRRNAVFQYQKGFNRYLMYGV